MTGLSELVAPGGVEEFLDTTWGRQMRVYPGDEGRFAHLLPWTALNEILRRHRLEAPRLRLAKNGEPVAVEQYTTAVVPRRGPAYRRLDPARLAEQLRAGATLVIDSIDELYGPIDELTGDFERKLRERAQVNCYVSFGATHGFATHWDDHDVLAIQVHGHKHWRVFGPTRRHPTRRDVEQPQPPTGELEHDFVLTSGDVLHVPRGWWHDANALEAPSVHLTFGVASATGVDFVTWIADEMRRHELARQDLPRGASDVVRTQRVKELAELVAAEFADPDALGRFFVERDAMAPPRAWGGLPYSVGGELDGDDRMWIRMHAPRAVLTESDGLVELAADGRRFVFAAAAGGVLRMLTDGRTCSIVELVKASGGLDTPTVRALCTDLVRQGLATAGSP